MLGTHDLWGFLLASCLLWATPGPDILYILTRSLGQGRRAGIVSVLGISTGVLMHTLFAAFGLSVILATSAWAFAAVKIAGAAYLVYLGIHALRTKTELHPAGDLGGTSTWQIYRQGVRPFLFLGAVFVIGGTLWDVGVAVCAAGATRAIRRNPALLTWLARASGCVYIGLGLNLLRSRPHTA